MRKPVRLHSRRSKGIGSIEGVRIGERGELLLEDTYAPSTTLFLHKGKRGRPLGKTKSEEWANSITIFNLEVVFGSGFALLRADNTLFRGQFSGGLFYLSGRFHNIWNLLEYLGKDINKMVRYFVKRQVKQTKNGVK